MEATAKISGGIEQVNDYAIDSIAASMIIVYIVMIFLTFREVELMRTEYRVGEGKRAECKPAYAIGETGNYNVAEVLPTSLTNLTVYFKMSIYILLFMSTFIVYTSFAANKSDFVEYWKYLPNIKIFAWGCLFVTMLALMLRTLSLLKKNKLFENNGATKRIMTPLMSTIVSLYSLNTILTNMDKKSSAEGTLIKLTILFFVTMFSYAVITRQNELTVAYNEYNTSTKSLKESLDIIQKLPLTNFDRVRYQAYLAEVIADAEQKRFTSETLDPSYLAADAQTWKYILNEDGGELSGAFPGVDDQCSANLDVSNAAPATDDPTKFAMSRKFFACTIPANDPSKSYFQYQRLESGDGGRIDAVVDGKIVNLIDAIALTGLTTLDIEIHKYVRLRDKNKNILFEFGSLDGSLTMKGKIMYIEPPIDYRIIDATIKIKHIEFGTISSDDVSSVRNMLQVLYYTESTTSANPRYHFILASMTPTNIQTLYAKFVVVIKIKIGSNPTEYRCAKPASFPLLFELPQGTPELTAYIFKFNTESDNLIAADEYSKRNRLDPSENQLAKQNSKLVAIETGVDAAIIDSNYELIDVVKILQSSPS